MKKRETPNATCVKDFRARLDQMIDLHSLAALAADKIGKEVCFPINRAALETRLGNVLDYLKENT